MDLNTFTIDQLPFQTSDTLPNNCTKYDVAMGAVPNEKDNTNPNMYMDKIFAAGGEQPVPPTPVGPRNKIWYTTTDGEIYDLASIIELLSSLGGTYNGPAVVSNEWDDEKEQINIKKHGTNTMNKNPHLDSTIDKKVPTPA